MSPVPEKPPSPVQIWADVTGQKWVLIVCPYCHTDLSKVSHGRTTYNMAMDRELFETYHPIRCTECNHPLLPFPVQSSVVKPAAIS